jgi:mRNA-degrading endonuclease toxin of MazEF toxin-antitoxin module
MTPAALRRGTMVTVASPGAYSGKPRPAVVVQADRWLQGHRSVTVCPCHQHPQAGTSGADRRAGRMDKDGAFTYNA